MANSNLVLHRGAKAVSLEELQQFQAPPPEGRWFPLSHGRVLSVVTDTLGEAGYLIEKQQLGVMRDGSRFFGTLDLKSPVADGVSPGGRHPQQRGQVVPARLLRREPGVRVRQPGVPLGAAGPPQAHRLRRARLRPADRRGGRLAPVVPGAGGHPHRAA